MRDGLLRDVRYGLRALRRSPQVALPIVFTLVVGIGINTVVFSAFEGVLVVAVVLATIVPAVAAARTPPWEGAADR